MTEILLMGGGVGVVLLIICLIVREQTNSRIRSMRTELMSLRSREKRLADRCDEIERMESQMREALMRTSRCQHELGEASKRFTKKLGQLHMTLRGEEMPELEEQAEEQPEDSQA